ncbi:MAG: AAA family ATPase [Planctomycetota bacterium]
MFDYNKLHVLLRPLGLLLRQVMLTRLRVQGFKNLLDVEVRFGPFTCIAGHNAAGKSNLFDAITFLSLLAKFPIMEAVSHLRASKVSSTDGNDLLTKCGDYKANEIRFTADMVVDRHAEDDFGVTVDASISSMRYEVAFQESDKVSGGLIMTHESLKPLRIGDARKTIGFDHSPHFRKIVAGRRTVDFISTNKSGEITIHQEGHGGRKLPATRSSRTVLSGSANADFASVLAAHREMASWRSLMLEPSAMRSPSQYNEPRYIDERGAYLPNTLYRLGRIGDSLESINADIANRLSTLVDDVRSIRIVEDDRYETRTLEVCGRDGIFRSARSLSDGTLRFLVLAALENDSELTGVLCLEEPENGIHPERISAMVELLRDIAVDETMEIDEDNPLRQVIINTHSPLVVQSMNPGELIYMEQGVWSDGKSSGVIGRTFVREDTWRGKLLSDSNQLAPGMMKSYVGDPSAINEQRRLWTDWVTSENGH